MITIRLSAADDLAGWREQARRLDAAEIKAADVVWRVPGEAGDLFAIDQPPPAASGNRRSVPRRFLELVDLALLHREPTRFALAYRVYRRLKTEGNGLLELAGDADIAMLHRLARAVRRDKHKMKAFVRFREVEAEDGAPAFIAYFRPDHHIVQAIAPFFQRRFATMRWSILTPEVSVHWDGERLIKGEGATRDAAPDEDRLEEHWRTYFASIFNPARLKLKAMQSEMPKKYWQELPEAALIEPLTRMANARVAQMMAEPATAIRPRDKRSGQLAAQPPSDASVIATPAPSTLADLKQSLGHCTRCPLYRPATQAVSGEGPLNAQLMIVGEQPGDQEDLTGRPLIGPAGQLFDQALARVGIERSELYVTNAVKHFKYEPRGKRRIHQKPNIGEIDHCRWWLDIERSLVQPRLIVAMGGSAVRAVLGRNLPVTANRGRVIQLSEGSQMLITFHPAYLLRLTDQTAKRVAWHEFLDDLRKANQVLSAAV